MRERESLSLNLCQNNWSQYKKTRTFNGSLVIIKIYITAKLVSCNYVKDTLFQSQMLFPILVLYTNHPLHVRLPIAAIMAPHCLASCRCATNILHFNHKHSRQSLFMKYTHTARASNHCVKWKTVRRMV